MSATETTSHHHAVSAPPAKEMSHPAAFRPFQRRALGAVPWWVLSVTVHSMLLFLATLIVVASAQPEARPL